MSTRGTITAVQDHGSIITTIITPDDPLLPPVHTHWDRRQFEAFYDDYGTAIKGLPVVVSYSDAYGPIVTPAENYFED